MNAKLSVAILIVLLVSIAYSAPSDKANAPLKATIGNACDEGFILCGDKCYKQCSVNEPCAFGLVCLPGVCGLKVCLVKP
ncbi:hypothetical protein GPALN_012416 [Globodera pallida]|nr:hypothetical protein GPALN_012416 [Globodera pallida]